MNILKSCNTLENDEFRKISKHFQFEQTLERVLSGVSLYRFFIILRPTPDTISFIPQENIEMLTNILELEQFLNMQEKAILLEIQKPKTFSIFQKKRISTYLHLDWILAFNKIREFENEADIPFKLTELFRFMTSMSHKDILRKIQGSAKQRSNIYTVNKDSIIVSITNNIEEQNTQKLSCKTIEFIKSIPLISFIEISKGVDEKKLYEFLLGVKKACSKLCDEGVMVQ